MINNFPTSKAYNQAGLLDFLFAHHSSIAAFSGIFNGKVLLPLSFIPNMDWLKGYSTVNTLNFVETEKSSEQGKYYEQTISGFVPADRAELIALMEEMDDQNFVLLIKDSNQQNRLVGGFGSAMLFSAVFDSGTTKSDSKGFQFKFYTESTFRAPVYL